MDHSEATWHVTITFGVVLSAALLGGLLAERLHLPKVTAYLLVGILLGPVCLDWVPEPHVELLEPLMKMAMALVLFNLGCSFSLVQLRRLFRRVWPLSLGEMGLTFVLVSVAVTLVGASWRMGALLGALAVATAPATTILVLKESESEGPLTRLTGVMVAVNNLVAIVLFEVLFLALGRDATPEHSVGHALLQLVLDVFGSLLLGLAAGLIVGYTATLLSGARWLVMLVGGTSLVLGVCETLDLPYMVAFLAMGMAVANSSDRTKDVVSSLDRLTVFLCVVFFVVHGAELQLDKFVEAGAVGAAYVAARLAGKYFGVRWPAAARGEDVELRRWLGAALIAQAGAAIALSAIAARRNPSLGAELQTIILGTVVFFEIAGPILIRQAVVRAGEVPMVNVVRAHRGLLVELQLFRNRLLAALGRDPLSRRAAADVNVGQLMRRNVRGLPQSSTFSQIASFIEHSQDETFPVVGQKEQLVGVIRYRDLSNALFDPQLGTLVRAADLAEPADLFLYPDDPVSKAWDLFRSTRDDSLPVVSREHGQRLEGIVRRKDIFRLFVRGQRGEDRTASGH